jgi:uncharacterized membrane protein
MELPALKLPQIPLPFDIPALLHPPVVHFVIAIPILVLVVEIINLIAKKRAIGVITFFILILGMVMTAAAYLTGTVDGKEAFDALSQAGQAELKEHKLLGTYLVLGSAVVVVFKMISAILQRGLAKAMYLLVLIVFTLGILKQGKDGGELVYEYGANVERVSNLDSELFDAKEEIDELKEAAKNIVKKTEEKAEEVKKEVKSTVKITAEKANEIKEKVNTAVEAAEKAVESEESAENTASKAQNSVEAVKETVIDKVEKAVPAEEKALSENVKSVQEKAETISESAVKMPEEAASSETVEETEGSAH